MRKSCAIEEYTLRKYYAFAFDKKRNCFYQIICDIMNELEKIRICLDMSQVDVTNFQEYLEDYIKNTKHLKMNLIIVHDYGSIQLNIIYDTVKSDLPN